jgi:hypothetical protein
MGMKRAAIFTMKPFTTLSDARIWCASNADGDLTVFRYTDGEQWQVTQHLRWSANLQRFVVNF